MNKLILLAAMLALIGCESSEEKKAKLDQQVLDFINTALKKDLIDPSSLQVRDLQGYCGEANSKNRLGGYVGFKKFIVLNENEVVFQNDSNTSSKQFTRGWAEICKETPNFDNKDQLIKPNFKLPDPVYDPPKFEANGKTIVTTPSTLTMDGDYNYIYPYLIFRCDEQNKLDLILSSYMQAAYSNGGYHMLVSNPKKEGSHIYIPIDSSGNFQSFNYEKQKLFKFLKANDEVSFAFTAIGDQLSAQTYDLKPVKEALANNKLSCNW